jgi:general secretion pathway protein E
VPYYLLNSTFNGVMAQRLVRTLCPHCKQAGEIKDEAWEMLVTPWKANKPANVYYAKGCLECRMTGYMGRVGLYEMLTMTPVLRRLVTTETDLQALTEQCYKEGMKPLRISGAAKIAAGVTTIDEVLKVAPPAAGDPRKAAR